MLIAEFAYNKAKNTNINYIEFELNYDWHLRVLFEKNIDPRSRSSFADKLAEKLRELIKIYYQNFLYAQKLQKRVYDKVVKSCSYAPGKKIYLNCKYIKIKINKKLEDKFFRPFQVFHAIKT